MLNKVWKVKFANPSYLEIVLNELQKEGYEIYSILPVEDGNGFNIVAFKTEVASNNYDSGTADLKDTSVDYYPLTPDFSKVL